jgi:hypothetical protein
VGRVAVDVIARLLARARAYQSKKHFASHE